MTLRSDPPDHTLDAGALVPGLDLRELDLSPGRVGDTGSVDSDSIDSALALALLGDALDADRAGLAPGARVEVWCASLTDWVRGFEVHEITDGGITVMRLSDGAVLPEAFEPAQVRPASSRARSGAWG